MENSVVFIKSQYLGEGDKELGAILMKSFISSMANAQKLPKSILLVNSAVHLACTNEQTVENFKLMAEKGVDIICCGTCIDYYNLRDKIQVGIIGNMAGIVEELNSTSNKLCI